MSMKQIESGFQTISNALKTGQFSKRDLEFIVAFSESVKRGATNVLNRIAPNSEKVELAPTHNSASTPCDNKDCPAVCVCGVERGSPKCLWFAKKLSAQLT